LGLLALPAPAAQPVAMPANLPLYFEAGQGQANARRNSSPAAMITNF
jgi:hypothetical protein